MNTNPLVHTADMLLKAAGVATASSVVFGFTVEFWRTSTDLFQKFAAVGSFTGSGGLLALSALLAAQAVGPDGPSNWRNGILAGLYILVLACCFSVLSGIAIDDTGIYDFLSDATEGRVPAR